MGIGSTVLKTAEVEQGDMTNAVFQETQVEQGLVVCIRASWRTDLKSWWPSREDAEVLLTTMWHEAQTITVEVLGTGIVRVEMGSGQAHVAVAAKDLEAAEKLLGWLREAITPGPEEDGIRPVFFWTYGPHGASASSRKIDVPKWAEIELNYTGSVADEIARVTGDGFRPSFGGQLMLWQGDPGTGKTWALRSLMWEWHAWAEFHYIVDPEHFFGSNSDYMMAVLLSSSDMELEYHGDGRPATVKEPPWKVLILEDCGELLTADAKERSGQALSRLLNVVDGIIGQGLRVLVLITTNEEVKDLHPAVMRAGRCASHVVFRDLEPMERMEWLAARGVVSAPSSSPGNLAQLYAIVEKRSLGGRRAASVGFGS